MPHTNAGHSSLQALAYEHAMAVVAAEARDATGTQRQRELLMEFRRARQPFLSDKQYTALYRTFSDLVLTEIKNYYAPGSAIANAPVKTSDVKDGEELYRPNPAPLNPEQWVAHLAKVKAMAERFAREIAVLVETGGNVAKRLEEQQYEAAKFSMDHGLDEDESPKETAFYKQAYQDAMQQEVEHRKRQLGLA